MIRLGVYSRSDVFLRVLSQAVRGVPDLSVELLLRSGRELAGPGSLDVLVIDADRAIDAGLLIERVAPLPVVLLAEEPIARELARWRLSLDGWGLLRRGDGLSPDDPDRLLAAARAAASGLVVTDSAPEREAGDGLEPDLAEGADGAVASSARTPRELLTVRELDVLALLARGRSNHEIAGALGVSANTVKYHLSGIFSKLDVGTRSEATFEAIRRGLVAV
ncbi:MAG: helix-turn-helix domain-containing protein [Spirochaetota bacterium]